MDRAFSLRKQPESGFSLMGYCGVMSLFSINSSTSFNPLWQCFTSHLTLTSTPLMPPFLLLEASTT